MDILKVLSRGTKRSSKAGQSSSNAAAPNLPSAGNRTNPQLFNDDARGQKRKRGGDRSPPTDEHVVAEDLPDVDFFAPKAEPMVAAPKKNESKGDDDGDDDISSAPTPPSRPRLTDEECRQILKSHRLKVTLMSKPEDTSRVKKSKKKKKKNSSQVVVAAETTKKDEKRQLTPQPLGSFGELRSVYGISRRVAENLVAQGYREPTEVQLGSLPMLLRPEVALGGEEEGLEQGVDFLAVAPTGSGKTISFLIAAVNGIMRRRWQDKVPRDTHELEAVIIAPTRELSHQIVNEGQKILQGTGLRVLAMNKHMQLSAEKQTLREEEEEEEESGSDEDEDAESDQESASAKEAPPLKKEKKKTGSVAKADLLVTTPALLLNFLSSGPAGSSKVLPSVRDLVLDEADVLLDPLFREQTFGIWTACTNPDLRTSCWSATMGSNIESLATEKLNARAALLGISPKPLVRLVVGLKDTAVPNITHKLTYTASEQGKLLALRQLLRPTAKDDSGPPLRPPFLVFTQTIDRAGALHEELKYDIPLEAGGSARIAALHGGLADSARSAVMRRFRAGEIWVLITTDVLARGVDFAGVNGVVNYDVPGSSAAYVHRVGRTGRAGREGGVAVTFYTKEDIPFVKTVANVIAASERQAGKEGAEAGVQKWLLDALPKVGKADRKMLRERGVEARRSGAAGGNGNGGKGGASRITTTSGYERQKEANRRGAIEGSKKRRLMRERDEDGAGGEWGGFAD
ncbi:hypothetical protein N3K66_005688 [Trichothecium roseum]|uniref:Uncharacterized protein n=1 Tax=Trichothecium roseum TaxID=47278 RepID=A0ACC0UYJ8_9HYPO|nr:hypothetical protein N3K66_005688 [Trichothecium roseum]